MTSNDRSTGDLTRSPRGLLRLRRTAPRAALVPPPSHPQSHVVPLGFAPALRAVLAGDEPLTADTVLALAKDRADAGVTWIGFRGELERAWRAIGQQPPVVLVDLASSAWPEHAA